LPPLSTTSPLSVTSTSGGTSLTWTANDPPASAPFAVSVFDSPLNPAPISKNSLWPPAFTALSFQTGSIVAPGFSGPKEKVLSSAVSAPADLLEPASLG